MSRGRLWLPSRREEFDPRTIPGLSSWWTAEDAETTSTRRVYRLPDRARPGVDFSQATDGNRPFLQDDGFDRVRPSLRIFGHTLKSPVAQTTLTYTMFLSVHIAVGATNGTGFYNGSSGANGYGLLLNASKVGGLHGGVAIIADGAPITTPEIWTVQHSATEFYRSGVAQGVGNFANPAAPSTEAKIEGIDGWLGEGLMFNRVLSTLERALVHRYLARRWTPTQAALT